MVGKKEQIVVIVRDKKLFDEILIAHTATAHTDAAPSLLSVFKSHWCV